MENQISSPQLWTGRILSILVILFMLFDAGIKFAGIPEVTETTVGQLGFQPHHILLHGILCLVATLIYAIPRTSIFGAVILTGYLGGAVASHVRIDNPLFSHTLFPVYIGLLAWVGLWMRNGKLREVFPLIR
jgi:hypothetical protein